MTCGTIEPRKNHALLVDVWRRFVAEQGPSAPKLVVVGKRGWNFTQIVEALADPALGGAVIEVAGLSNGGWRALLAGAAALLAPSFAEGYGLPLAEALTAGAPALCSNIAPFQEIGGEAAIYLDPRLPGSGLRESWISQRPEVRRGRKHCGASPPDGLSRPRSI
ncbi:MAG: glycosyltransferase [Methylobacteriaceae bacterium]|nr:glycosyltransferase [Methylobacteriaceae bacterium]